MGKQVITETEIEQEARSEFTKKPKVLAEDIIREANTLPTKPACENENLDIIKHLVKRLALHQISLDARAKKMTFLLVVLSIIMSVGAIYTIRIFYCKP